MYVNCFSVTEFASSDKDGGVERCRDAQWLRLRIKTFHRALTVSNAAVTAITARLTSPLETKELLNTADGLGETFPLYLGALVSNKGENPTKKPKARSRGDKKPKSAVCRFGCACPTAFLPHKNERCHFAFEVTNEGDIFG